MNVIGQFLLVNRKIGFFLFLFPFGFLSDAGHALVRLFGFAFIADHARLDALALAIGIETIGAMIFGAAA